MKWPVKALIGAALGVAIWKLMLPLETALLGVAANVLFAVTGSETRLWTDGLTAAIRSPRAISANGGSLRVDLLTFNTIVLAVLLASNARRKPAVEIRRSLVALALLFATHLLGVVATANATLVATLAAQNKEVSWLAANVWFAIAQGYQVVLAYAFAFAIWWGLSPAPPGSEKDELAASPRTSRPASESRERRSKGKGPL